MRSKRDAEYIARKKREAEEILEDPSGILQTLIKDESKEAYRQWQEEYLNTISTFEPAELTQDNITDIIHKLADIDAASMPLHLLRITVDEKTVTYICKAGDVREWQGWYTPERRADPELMTRLDACIGTQKHDILAFSRKLNEIYKRDKELQEAKKPIRRKKIKSTGTELTRYETISTIDAQGILGGFLDPAAWANNEREMHREYVCNDRLKLVVKHEDNTIPADVYTDPALLRLWMEPLKQITDRFNDLTALVHLILQMHWLEHKNETGWATLSPVDILKYRGMKLWNGEISDKELIKISKAINNVLRPRLIGNTGPLRMQIEGCNKYKTVEGYVYKGPVWHSEKIVIAPLPGFGEDLIERIKYQPSEWVTACMAPYARYLMKIAPTMLGYDLNSQTSLFRLGLALDFYYKVNSDGLVRVKMGSLLEKAKIKITERNYKHPGDFMNKIERDIEKLRQDGIIGSYTCAQDPRLPGKAPIPAWLKRVWEFTPPLELLERYNKTHTKRQKIIENKKNAQAAAERKALEAGDKNK